ncbi:MAG: DUF2142 domain-containing protein [Anaerolineales bacterium]
MKRKFIDPAILFLILGVIIGVLYAVAVPYGAGFDEEQHIVRIYDIAGYNFLPNRNPPNFNSTVTFKEFFDLSYQRRYAQSPAFDMFSPEMFGQKLDRSDANMVYGFATRSIYSPVMFAPQAILARLFWMKYDFPILPIVIAMRLVGLLVYLVACYLAIRIIPFGKWMLTILALAPMSLYQAATLNADGFTNGVSFLFIAVVLYVYASEQETIQPKWIWALVICSLLLGLAKPATVVILPLLLPLPLKRFAPKKWIVLLALGALFAVIINFGWTALSIPNSNFSSGQSQNVSGNLGLIFADLGGFIVTYLKDIVSSLVPYYKDWIGAYGYWVGIVPAPVYFFFTILLITVALLEKPSEKLTRNIRLFMVGLFLVSCALVMSMFFVANYVPGATGILGRQGRYFIPFAPLLFIALSGLVSLPDLWKKVLQWIAAGSFLLSIGYYSLGMYATYYTDCGYATFTGGRCSLPSYMNLDKIGGRKVELTSGVTINQTFVKKCTGLSAVYVLVKSVPETSAGTVHLYLFDEEHSLLASRDIPVGEIHARDYLNLPLNVSTDGKGKLYEIRLEAEGMDSSQVLGIGADKSDFYVGDLSINGELSRGDLIIRYVCPAP